MYVIVKQNIEFHKATIPDDSEEKIAFAKKLAKFKVSLSKYNGVLSQKELKP